MLAAHRDQENLAHAHQAGAAVKQQNQNVRHVQPKTPGARYPKTPLKVPLNDENGNRGAGGKSVLRARVNNENMPTGAKSTNGLGKSSIVTPLEPRTSRAPLGDKTTNAKARTAQKASVKQIVRDIERTVSKHTTTKKLKQGGPSVESSKLEIHNDQVGPLEEEDIEYAPPRSKDALYESDIIPRGALTVEGLKPENRLRGYYNYYFNKIDENGMSQKEREDEAQRQRALERLDEQVRRDMDEWDWSVGDVPETKDYFKKKEPPTIDPVAALARDSKTARSVSRHATTIAARNAASALSMMSNDSTSSRPLQGKNPSAAAVKQPGYMLPLRKAVERPAPLRNSSSERATALAASRSTLGYSKGRTTSTVVRAPNNAQGPAGRTLARSTSVASSKSDSTITPARFAHGQGAKHDESEPWKKLEFLSIFDVDEEDDGSLVGSTPISNDDLEDDFELKLDFS